jgi:hypothetical protein
METSNNYDWHDEPVETETRWLVHGLIPADGYTAIVGKPKAGKSTTIRNLIAAVIKGRDFLDRPIGVPPNTGTADKRQAQDSIAALFVGNSNQSAATT